MQALKKFILHDQTFWLSPQRCIFWEEQRSVIVSDLHFGKTGHFRKSGIGVPQSVYKEDLQRLVSQIQHHKAEQLIVVGDLFHSIANKELDLFCRWRHDFSNLHIQLVKGNHDILKMEWYTQSNISVSDKSYQLNKFCFVHDIKEACNEKHTYYLSGHIHPAVIIKGTAKQSFSLPCYYFGSSYAVLPAFSKFTGSAVIDPQPHDHVFAIIPENHSKGQPGTLIKL